MAGSVLLVLLALILRLFLARLALLVEVVDQRGPHPGEDGVGGPGPPRAEPGDQLLGPLIGDRGQPS